MYPFHGIKYIFNNTLQSGQSAIASGRFETNTTRKIRSLKMTAGRVNPQFTLEKQGINGLGVVQ